MWPFDRLFGKSGPTTEELQSGGWPLLLGSLTTGDGELWDQYSQSELADIYRKSSLAHACIREVATSASEPPIQAGRATDEGDFEIIEDHWAPALLRRPNKYYDYRLLIYYIVARKLATGRAFVWKWQNQAGTAVRELWPVPTHWVGIQTGSGSELISGYRIWQGRGGKTIPVPPEDIINSYYPDIGSTYKAIGPLQAASRDYQMDRQRENYVAEMMDNLTVPGLGIFAREGMSPDRKKRLRASLKDRAGKGSRGGTIFLEGQDVDAKLFNPLADMDLPGLVTMAESRVCMAFGVPPELLGARTGLEHSTYSNKAEARESFYKETMVPLWRSLQSVLTRGLLWPADEQGVELRFDLSGIRELQQDRNELAERASILYKNGIASRNEARRMSGLPEVDTDYRLTPVGGVEQALEEE